jgi:Protein of unknown function (DUF3987)
MPRQLKEPWLDAFERYCADMEAPKEYIRWAGISVLSSSLKRRCYLWYRGIKFYPNQYIILVGPPGIGKGESINAATELSNNVKSVNYIKDWVTPQEIIEELSAGFQHIGLKPGQVITTNVIQDHTCCIMAPELAVFLQQYDNLHSLMCAWWDQNKFDYKTKNKGKHVIEDMSVSMLGGCVPDYVRSLSKDRLAPITGGFTARTIFVYATEKFQLVENNFGIPSQQINQLKNDLINDLKHITTLQGELSVSKDAAKLWEETYKEHNKRGAIDSDASTNFKSRISSHIIKTAITTCISESDNLIITRDHLRRAIEYIEAIRDKVDVVFRSVGESPLAVSLNKVVTYIDFVGITTYKNLVRFIYRDATIEQLTAIISVLKQADLIVEKINIKGEVEYWSTKYNQQQGVVNP